jgi:hypothetical protein
MDDGFSSNSCLHLSQLNITNLLELRNTCRGFKIFVFDHHFAFLDDANDLSKQFTHASLSHNVLDVPP